MHLNRAPRIPLLFLSGSQMSHVMPSCSTDRVTMGSGLDVDEGSAAAGGLTLLVPPSPTLPTLPTVAPLVPRLLNLLLSFSSSSSKALSLSVPLLLPSTSTSAQSCSRWAFHSFRFPLHPHPREHITHKLSTLSHNACSDDWRTAMGFLSKGQHPLEFDSQGTMHVRQNT
ncbi:hypothetical protein T439DRAFT_324206 [Meredithblackwellia eburnea MCA 4105]